MRYTVVVVQLFSLRKRKKKIVVSETVAHKFMEWPSKRNQIGRAYLVSQVKKGNKF